MEQKVSLEFLALHNLYIKPNLLENSKLDENNLTEVCKNNIANLTANFQKCERLDDENSATKRSALKLIKEQINNEITNLENALKQQDAADLKSILQEGVENAKIVAKDKTVSEMLLKLSSNQTAIINDLLSQRQQIEQIQRYTINYVKAQLNMFTYTDEEQQEIKKLLASTNRKFTNTIKEYNQYKNEEVKEEQTTQLAGA